MTLLNPYFDPPAAQAIGQAKRLAHQMGHPYLAPAHVLCAMLEPGGPASRQLTLMGKNVDALRQWANYQLAQEPISSFCTADPLPTDEAERLFENAALVRQNGQTGQVTLHSLLVALCLPGVAFTAAQLSSFGLSANEVAGLCFTKEKMENEEARTPQNSHDPGCLRQISTVGFGPTVEREELADLCEVFARMEHPNALLIGEPGVGKTELARQFLQKTMAGGTACFELDATQISAAAGHKKEAADLTRASLAGAVGSLVFIENIHLLFDRQDALAGAGEVLKKAMAEGRFRVLATTTPEGFRQHIEREAGVAKCFETVRLAEPSEAGAAAMVEVKLPEMTAFHGIQIAPSAVGDAVRLAARFLRERRLPAAAIDLLDRGMAAAKMAGETTLDRDGLARAVAAKTGIPVGNIRRTEREKLSGLESLLQGRLIGQDPALAQVSQAFRKHGAGMADPLRPIASLFLLGPTGTGKTELAKAIADIVFGDERALLRFNMNEFSEKHTVARLTGAPPGYVGYEEGGFLVNRIRQRPYSVVLFDEVEKAHHEVFDTLLTLLDEGSVEDKQGTRGDFRNAIILFTSNIGSSFICDEFRGGNVPGEERLIAEMGRHFRPEFINRLDGLVPFAPLSGAAIEGICGLQIGRVQGLLAEQGIQLEILPAAKQLLATAGHSEEFGARPLKRAIDRLLRTPISELVLSGKLACGQTLTVGAENDKINFNIH